MDNGKGVSAGRTCQLPENGHGLRARLSGAVRANTIKVGKPWAKQPRATKMEQGPKKEGIGENAAQKEKPRDGNGRGPEAALSRPGELGGGGERSRHSVETTGKS